jgi:hypothetical protein
VPNSSDNACAARCLDRNCPTYRYRTIAVIRGPYCTRGHLFRRGRTSGGTAAAAPLDQLMLDHLDPRRRQIEHLPPLHAHLVGARQIRPALRAPTGLVAQCLVRVVHQFQGQPGCPGCPPGLRPLLPRNGLGAGLSNGESDDGGFDEFCEFNPAAASAQRPRPATAPTPPAAQHSAPAAQHSPPRARRMNAVNQQAPHHDSQPLAKINATRPSSHNKHKNHINHTHRSRPDQLRLGDGRAHAHRTGHRRAGDGCAQSQP